MVLTTYKYLFHEYFTQGLVGHYTYPSIRGNTDTTNSLNDLNDTHIG